MSRAQSRNNASAAKAHSKLAIYGAIGANIAITLTKFTVASITGSSAMLSEGVDSAVDTFNGLLLACVAMVLTWESRGLMIGEGIRPETAQAIRELALAQPSVQDVGRVLSMYVGPDDVLVTMDLDFNFGTDAAEAGAVIGNVECQVRERFLAIRRLFIESGSAPVWQRWSRPDAVRPPVEAPASQEFAPPPSDSP